MTEKHLSNQRFTDFALDPDVVRGIEAAGFEYCTPIQAEALPHLLKGRDVAGQAQTGTGKTAAFLVALFQHLITHPAAESRKDSQPRALILAPTRELAIQIDKDAQLLGKHLDLRIRLVYGGTGYEKQRRDLEAGVDVLIGTPGRAIDYLKQGIYDLGAIQVMVLDEADRMFDLGFIKDIRYLFRKMPHATERLSMLFSATLSLRVNELAYEHMNNPRKVTIEAESITVENVTQRVYFPSNEDKLPLLLGLLKEAGDTRTVVFLNTKYQSERVAHRLEASGFKAGVLSGDVPQNKREKLLERFKAGEINVLVATDVAARGLHIPDVALVVNYDLPQDPEDYVHRIGRTARVGATGKATSFACETYAFSLPDIEAFIGQKIEPASYDQSMLVQPSGQDMERSRGRGRDRKQAGKGERKPRSGDRQPRGRKAGKPKEQRAEDTAPAAEPAKEPPGKPERDVSPTSAKESKQSEKAPSEELSEKAPSEKKEARKEPSRKDTSRESRKDERVRELRKSSRERPASHGESQGDSKGKSPGEPKEPAKQPGTPGRNREIPAVG